MKKQLIITVAFLFILAGLLCGCNEQTNNNNTNNPIDYIELVSHYINIRDDLIEVNGVMKNNGSTTVDAVAEVLFYNANNELIYSSTYTVYNFVNGTTADFYVMYLSADPNYEQYDHYDIELKLLE